MYSVEGEIVTRPEGALKAGELVTHTSKQIEVAMPDMPDLTDIVKSQADEGHIVADAIVKVWDEHLWPSPDAYYIKIGQLVAFKIFTNEKPEWKDMYKSATCTRSITSSSGLITPETENPTTFTRTGPLKISI
mgnify:CR=1 FL=1